MYNNNGPKTWRLVIGILCFLPVLFFDSIIILTGISNILDAPGYFVVSLFFLLHFGLYIIDFVSLVSKNKYNSHLVFKSNHRGLSITAGVMLIIITLFVLGVWFTIISGAAFKTADLGDAEPELVAIVCTVIIFMVVTQSILMIIDYFKNPAQMPMQLNPYGMPQQPMMQNGNPFGTPQQPMMQNGNPFGTPQQPMMQNGNPFGSPQQPMMQNGNPFGSPQQPMMQNDISNGQLHKRKSLLDKEQYENPYSNSSTEYASNQDNSTVYADPENRY